MGDAPNQPPAGIWNPGALIGDAGRERPPDPAVPGELVPPARGVPAAPPEREQPVAGQVVGPGVEPVAEPSVGPVAGPSRKIVYYVAAVLVGLLALGIGITVLSARGGQPATPSADPGQPAVPVPSATTGPALAPPATPQPAESPSPSPSPPDAQDPEAAAVESLHSLRQQDQTTMVFDGRYAAQLASKTVGIVDPRQTAANGTHTFYAADILAEHLALRQGDNLGAQVVLALSTDYGRRQLYQGEPLWVTFALGDFDSAGAVRAWCGRRFPQLAGDALLDQCAARKLEPPE